MTGVLAGTIGAFTMVPAEAVNGTAAGRVFRDFNMNGAFDTTTSAASPAVDVGIANVTVRAYDKDNNVVATGTSGATGTYSLSYNTSTTTANVRLEFDTPTRMVPSRSGVAGATSDTDVQFVSTGVTDANLGLVFPQDYSPANPNFAFARQVGAIKLDGTAQNTDAGTIFTNAYNTRGTTATTAAAKEATVTQTGSIWGLASLDDDYIFSAALLKRHAAVGPGGMGAVYLTAAGGTADATPFATVSNPGANPRPAMTTQAYFNDTTSYSQIGKVGLGGMTLAPDHSALYVVNLNTKSLVRIPITRNAAGVPVAGTQSSVAIPAPACTGDLRPFGVSSANGSLWVTQTCAATAQSNLRGYVYQYDLATDTFNTSAVLQIPLTGGRGFAFNPNQSATWLPWTDVTGTSVWPTNGTSISVPQPLLADVQFDSNGDMTVGIKDRFGDQAGFAGSPAGGTGVYEAMAAGDSLRACLSGTTFTLESNGSCGSRTGYGVGNGDGPGGGEFYSDDFNNGSHDQVSLGGLLQVPGFPQLINTTFDPKSPGGDPEYGTQGYRFFSNANGSFDATNGWRQVGQAVRATTVEGRESTYGKAGGMGDLDTLVKTPVEIGNRVWIDTDRDGIQEPGEPAVPGVQVSLLNAAGIVVGTTTTSATGEYYFNDANVTGGLVAGAAYKIRLQRASDFAVGGALTDYGVTTQNAGAKEKIDSDAAIVSTYPEISITAPRFGANHSYDFGFVRKAVSVGDFVWNDLDRDGIQDAGEPGIPGVLVTITGPGGAAVTNVYGAAVASTATGANGAYTFADLPALAAGQSYTVAVDNNQTVLVNAGYIPTVTGTGTSATDSSNGTAASGNLTTDGASDTTLDFGFVRKAVSVGDFAFVDSNRDGIQTAGETGIAGVTVTITKADGTAVTNVNGVAVTSTVTDANGKYSFDNLPAGGAYKVSINNGQAALADYVPTLTGAGTVATDSSNGSATSVVLSNNGDQDLTLDFGFVKPAVSVGDFIWVDTNRNGVQDSGEPGIGGVAVTITRTDGATVKTTLGATVTSTISDASGKYLFGNLDALPASVFYKVSVDNSQAALAGAGFVPTLTGAGTAATDSSNGSATSAALTTNGVSDLTLDFGFVKKAVSVGDFVWVDTNKNGIQDAGELGIPGVTVTITKADGTAVNNVNGVAVTSTVTDAGGKYSFDLLPAGVAYKVSINNAQAALADYVPTLTGAGTTATDSSNGSVTSVVLNDNGDSDLTLDFGFRRKTVSVGDFVFVDTDRDGIQDAGEPGINGVTVTISRTDGAPVKKDNGTVVTSTTTNATGAYSFSDLEALSAGVFYKVSIDNTQAVLSAYVPTITGAGTAATDSSTGSATSGALTNDGATDVTLDFGFVKPAVTVGNFVWFDTNGNGIQDAGEPGIQGVTVTLTKADGTAVSDVNGSAVTSTVTDANGAYTFALLPSGVAYKVSVDNAQAALFPYVSTLTGQGTTATDSSTGSATSGVLTGNGASDLTLDFGFKKKLVSVGDLVFVDTNRDGLQAAGEPGISGVTVTITRTDGAPVKGVGGATVTSTTTDALGRYLFANLESLPAGTHYVTAINNGQSALTAYVPTPALVGADRTVDSSTATSESGNLTSDGASDLSLDYGFVKPAVKVGDFVWSDTNGNGIQDAGEPGISGVTVRITYADGAAVTNVNGNPFTTMVTGTNGQYVFDLLPAGKAYTVTIDNNQAALNGYVPTLTGQGAPATDSSNGTYTTGVLTGNGATDPTADFGFKAAAPLVRLDKTASAINDLDGNGPDAGDSITYGFVVTNTGNVVLNPVTVNDPLFGGTSPNVTCGTGALAVGAARTCAPVTYPLTQADINAGTVNNTATAKGTAPNGVVVTDDDTTSTPVAPLKVSVGDFVFLDTNRNGIQDAGENGIAGVKLTIVGPTGLAVTDVNGNAVGAATTSVAGAYLFANLSVLPAGQHYTVKVDNTQPALGGYTPTQTGQGTPATDSSAGSATSGNLTADVASDKTLDFGFTRDVQTGVANLKVTKTVDKATPAVGDIVTYSLTVTNDGDAPANDVVLKDLLPSAVTFVSSDAPCTQANGTVSCSFGTLAAGQTTTVTIKAKVDNVPAGTTEERHNLDVQKVEGVIDVEAGQTQTSSVTCPTGYTVLDGSARIVSSGADVAMLENRATSLTTWTTTLRNQGADRAQNKIFALCVGNQTETVNGHSHQLQVSDTPTTQTVALASGHTAVVVSCAAGETPVQPGWKLDGAATVATSYPSGSSSWTFGVDNGSATSGLFAIRCLKNQVSTVNGHNHDLALAELFKTVTIPAGQSVDVVLDCAEGALGDQGAKGIVAGFDLPNGLVNLGHEPQPVRRVYTLSNTTSGPLDANLWLLCMGTRTAGHDGSGDVVNTASVTTSSPERTTNDNVASARFRVTSTPPAPVDKTNLRVTKTVNDTTPRVGDTVTYTLKATNDSAVAAAGVVLTDPLPSGVSFVSATAPCTLSGSTVVCNLGAVAAGATKTVTITATVDAVTAAGNAHDHYVDVQKVESHVALAAGETRSVTVDCAPGYLATDGSGRIDQIDQGTGTPDVVRIIRSAAADEDSWTVTMVNTATGNAQGKAFVVCAKKTTDAADGHTHDLVVSAPVAATPALTTGANTVTLTCATGRPIAPGYSVPADTVVRKTYPTGSDKWTFVVDATTAGTSAFSVRCLQTTVSTADGHSHDLSLSPITQSMTVAPGQTVEITSTCAGDAKGIVAGFTMGNGLVQLGNDPRPIIRVFRFYNPTSTAQNVDVYLLCMTSKTSANTGSGSVVNTAYATTTTPETTTGDNFAGASFKVDTTAAPAPVASPASSVVVVASRQAFVSTSVRCAAGARSCSGAAVLVAAKTQRVSGTVVRKGSVLARTTYRIAAGKIVTVKMKPTALGKKALASKTVRTAQVKVGGKVRTVQIRRRG